MAYHARWPIPKSKCSSDVGTITCLATVTSPSYESRRIHGDLGIFLHSQFLMGRREQERHEHTGRKCWPRIQLRLSSPFLVPSKFSLSFSSSSLLFNRETHDTTEGERRRRETVNDERERNTRTSIGRAGTGTRPTISRKEPHYRRNTRRPAREPYMRSPIVSCGSETILMHWLGPFQNTHIRNGAL